MDFEFSEVQNLLRESVRKLVHKHAPPEYVRQCDRERTYPEELFQACAAAGLLALPFPEEYGGAGGSLLDMVIVAEEIARVSADLVMCYTGNIFCGLNLLRKGSERISNLAGLKFTDDNLMEFERCIAVAGGKMDLFLGREGMMLAGHCIGGKAAIGSAINFAAPVFRKLIRAFEAGDLAAARAAQARANAMLSIFVRFGGLRAQKAAMNMVGPDCGPLRPPLRALDERELALMRADLEAVGFFDLTRPE